MGTPEGRKLFSLAREGIKGSEWEEIVFPPPASDEDRKRAKILDKLEDHYAGQRKNIENAFNDFLEWEKNTL